jgi:hypothetical protein
LMSSWEALLSELKKNSTNYIVPVCIQVRK